MVNSSINRTDNFDISGHSLSIPEEKIASRTPLDLAYLGRNISSTESRCEHAGTAIERLSIIWKSNPSDKIKRYFFQAVVVSVPLYGCTILTQTKRFEKKLDVCYTRLIHAILNKHWKQNPAKKYLYCNLAPISKIVQEWQDMLCSACEARKNSLARFSDGLLTWTSMLANQQKHTFISSMQTLDVV